MAWSFLLSKEIFGCVSFTFYLKTICWGWLQVMYFPHLVLDQFDKPWISTRLLHQKLSSRQELFITKEQQNSYLLQGNFWNYQGMSLGWRNRHQDLHIVINETVIEQITLLGVTSDDQRSFFESCNECLQKSPLSNWAGLFEARLS